LIEMGSPKVEGSKAYSDFLSRLANYKETESEEE